MRTFSSVLSLLCLVAFSSPMLADGNRSENATSGSEVNAIIDVVLDHHIDPPTKQEMVLSGVRALFSAAGKPMPRGVSREISELSTPELIEEYVSKVVAEFDMVPRADAILMGGMLESVRGGAILRDAGANRVNAQVAANRYKRASVSSDDRGIPARLGRSVEVLH